MYQRFTDRARKVIAKANQEAERFNHAYIGTEHILLGLITEGVGVGVSVLKELDIDLTTAKAEVEKLMKAGPELPHMDKRPQTPRVKKVFEFAVEESAKLGHNYVGTEHLLLGLIRESDGVGATALRVLGLELEQVRNEVLQFLGNSGEKPLLSEPTIYTTPETQQACNRAVSEARNMGNHSVCTGHLLLTLLTQDKTIASRLLKRLGLTAEIVRDEIVKTNGRESGD